MKNTTLCYLEKNGAYLMLHRTKKENDINRDKWIGVGGHCEENESPDGCVRREVREETGFELQALAYRGVVTFVSDQCEGEYMHLFTSHDFSGTMISCDEGELAWIEKSRVSDLPIWTGDRIFLHLLAVGAPFFSLKLVYSADTLCSASLNGRILCSDEICSMRKSTDYPGQRVEKSRMDTGLFTSADV